MKLLSFVRRKWGLLGLILMLLVAGLWGWRETAVTHAADAKWNATYWNNKTLSGTPAWQGQENEINFEWGNNAPHSSVTQDNFSARWTRTINVSGGSYRFTATMDDGMRVWVDDVLIIDSWWDSQVHSMSNDVYLYPGDHRVKVEYYEAGAGAIAKLAWHSISGTAPVPISDWKGEYFNNTSLSGPPALVRNDQSINFNWGVGSPAWNTVAADQFSVRWTRTIAVEPGRYRFTVIADDGVRLRANGQLILDRWHDANGATYFPEVDLPGGSAALQLEYYENVGGARIHMAWQKIGGGSGGWRGQYFNNKILSGSPTLIRDDAAINFNWGGGAPATGIGADNFSVRWTRTVPFNAGRYRFSFTADDGVRLWVNGQLIINAWYDHPVQTFTANVDLPGGNIPIQVEYYENGGGAIAQLSWTAVSTPPPSSPTSGSGAVLVRRLNVRNGPGFQYAILTQLTQGQTVPLAGYRSADSNWVMVVVNGAQVWVSAHPAFLQTSVAVSSLPVWQGTPPSTGGPSTARVGNAFYVNLRQGPGVGFGVLTQVPAGAQVDLIGRNASATWAKLRLANGTVGWMNASYLNSAVAISSLPVVN